MSEDLIIREDGIGRLIRSVDALEIKLQNGGTSRWVRFNPRDQKSVNANGEYHAKDDGVDGYRTITVNVPTRTKSQEPGRDQEIFNPDTGTGYYTDDDGFLHEEFVPDEIRIMHVPDKTTYQDGEPIDLEGIVVQAYRDGEVWTSAQYPDGYIPAHELSATIAALEPQTVYTDGNVYIPYSDKIFWITYDWKGDIENCYETNNDKVGGEFRGLWVTNGTNYAKGILTNSKKDGQWATFMIVITNSSGQERRTYESKSFVLDSYACREKTMGTEFIKGNAIFDARILPNYEQLYRHGWDDLLSFVRRVILGMNVSFIQTTVDSGTCRVDWARPKDGKILSANFNITVREAS